VAQLGRLTQEAGRRSAALLAVLDEISRCRVQQAAADEIFFGNKPCLMVIEPASLCWLSGRLTDSRNGEEWAKEFRQLPNLRQATQDGGTPVSVVSRFVACPEVHFDPPELTPANVHKPTPFVARVTPCSPPRVPSLWS
jgi:hypothetical protein